ncbi:hypothetical protein [Planktothrix agardhii]|uniref:hypothetical protein n=1 Tax=Planktothrix agardhii TaxID=1160 RepID=UPI000DBAE02F|nr:hypothetical protein [Planktothrix agardhii]BBD53052.1 hypothetical protein NIES204_03150 [Planktothrix agardhii NIES-204]CAD5913733.1 hypothetical protein PCC7811_00208 [Planktothrix agardhii]
MMRDDYWIPLLKKAGEVALLTGAKAVGKGLAGAAVAGAIGWVVAGPAGAAVGAKIGATTVAALGGDGISV